ncbi:7885_t:CDS:1, partial [Acaulospora colombiana]
SFECDLPVTFISSFGQLVSTLAHITRHFSTPSLRILMESKSALQSSAQAEDSSTGLEVDLSAQRWRLREEIARLITSSINSKDKEVLLQTKKVAYNQVLDKLQPCPTGINPMEKFPAEILETIILNYITHWLPREEYLEKRSELLIPLAMVSKQWRNYIYSTPTLWNCISLRGNKGDPVASVVQGLKLSQDRVLAVVLEKWSNSWRE